MVPVELRCSLDGAIVEEVVAEDGVIAKLDTPAGVAYAKVKEQTGSNWLTRVPLCDRMGTKFPGDPDYLPLQTKEDGLHYDINSIFDYLFPRTRKLLKAEEVARVKRYATKEGKVEIEAIGYDKKMTGNS